MPTQEKFLKIIMMMIEGRHMCLVFDIRLEPPLQKTERCCSKKLVYCVRSFKDQHLVRMLVRIHQSDVAKHTNVLTQYHLVFRVGGLRLMSHTWCVCVYLPPLLIDPSG